MVSVLSPLRAWVQSLLGELRSQNLVAWQKQTKIQPFISAIWIILKIICTKKEKGKYKSKHINIPMTLKF